MRPWTNCVTSRSFQRPFSDQVWSRLVAGPICGQDLYIAHRWRGNRINNSQAPALVSQVISPVNNVWRFLYGPLGSLVLDIRERPVGETDLGRGFVPELQPHDLGAGRDEPTFHGQRSESSRRKQRSANLRRSSSSVQYDLSLADQGQTMVQLVGSATPIVHVFGVLAWTATARQFGGGPGSSVAVTVMSGVGLNP